MEGTSFSIPINKVKEILPDLAAGKPVHHCYIGAAMADCTPNWARQLNSNNDMGWKVPEVYGSLVSRVHPNTPASSGGLLVNDIIVDIAGNKIRSSDDASRCIDRALVGKDLAVTVLRNGDPVVLRLRPVDLATRLREIRAEQQRQRRRPRNLLEEILPLERRNVPILKKVTQL
jgi:serine protease Do